VVVLGPTASGKTALSLMLAEELGGEIVNFDSVALYRGVEAGTAKPTAQERARAVHHLLDVAEPNHVVTAGEYARRARAVIGEIARRGGLPIAVGGTGLFLRALLEGLFPGPQRSEALRQRLRARSARPGYLHKLLRRLDAEAADRVHPHDAPKLIRAIEVCLTSKEKMTALWKRGRDPLRGFSVLRLGLDPERSALYSRINQRARRMFDAGLIEETRRLMERHGAEARVLESLGYKQAARFLRGEIDRESAVRAAQQAHRNYAKRQLTWFRREPDVHWLRGFGDDPAIRQEAVEAVRSFLARARVTG